MTDRTCRLATTTDDVRRCFPVMQQLRAHLDLDRYLELVEGMQREGYQLAFVEDAGVVTAVAGFRLMYMLYQNGRVLYVDDLSTDAARRSQGNGQLLLDWLKQHARNEGCVAVDLDSGVHRFDAHRFYFRERMHVSSYHFTFTL